MSALTGVPGHTGVPAPIGAPGRGCGRAAALVVAAILSATGCGAGSSPGGSPSDPPTPDRVSVSVSVVQNRSDVSGGWMQLRVTNDGREALSIRRATLESAALSSPAVWRKGTTIPAGGTRDLPVRFPGAGCTADAADPVVRLEIDGAAVDAGAAQPGVQIVELRAADPHGRIRALTDADCFSHELAAAGTISLGALRAGDATDPAELQVRAESTGGDTGFTVESMASTVLFSTVGPDGAEASTAPVGLVLGPEAATAAAWVPIRPARCDPHALAEDKVGTIFRFSVEIHGGRSGTIALPAAPSLRAQLSEYFLLACGL